MKHTQQGFTLIELMIVVAIIGILAAVAIPSYQDYTARAQVSEAMSLTSGVKTAVSEWYADKGAFPSDPASVSATTSGKYVASIAFDNSGSVFYVDATMKSTGVNANIQDKVFRLATADSNTWECGNNVTDIAGASLATDALDAEYLPGACK